MDILRTVSRGQGICFGHAFVVREDDGQVTVWDQCSFSEAFEKTRSELEKLASDSDIFAAHYEMSQDPLIEDTYTEIKDDFIDDATACKEACEAICRMFEGIDDEYLRARVDDVKDVFGRILGHIEGRSKAGRFADIPQGSIIVAENLTPSDTVEIEMSAINGFVTEHGSTTSHVCIIAANNGKVAMVGVGGATEMIQNGQFMIVDASEGMVFVDPDEATRQEYERRVKTENEQLASVDVHAVAKTKNGKSVQVMANAGNPAEVKAAIEAGADGIGLLRSEFLYMESKDAFPSEETQFAAYREAATACGEKPLTIRTLDVGGDKKLAYWNTPKEENPFLGFRAIRVSMAMPDMFRNQLRAILRASAFGNIRIMFPMITSCEELASVLSVLDECKNELSESGIPFDQNIKAGIMIETPAAVLIAEDLAAMVDFFSLGTNDLTQYVMAADRGNSAISHIYNPFATAVQKAIKMAIDGAHNQGIECCMCGELASNKEATGMLLGYGLDTFSVSIPAIATIKYAITSL